MEIIIEVCNAGDPPIQINNPTECVTNICRKK